jgi:monoterpene epsilon-lactone hydrolase
MASDAHDALVARLRAEHPDRKPTPEVRPPLEHLRAARDAMEANALPVDPDVAMRECEVNGVPGIWFEPEGADPARVILYFHGGGFMFGTPRNSGHLIARLARAAGARCLGLDYRLSWMAPFPAALTDAVRAYRWLLADGVDPARIALAGDSAGGGLVVTTLVALRDADDPLPAAGVLTSAWTDLAVTGDSARTVDDPVASADGLRMLGDGYLQGADPTDPLASPLYADLTGLPPLLVQVGTQEVLLDDSTRLADKARAAGVDVTLEVLDGVIHIWQYYGPDLPETRASEAQAGAFIRQHTAE